MPVKRKCSKCRKRPARDRDVWCAPCRAAYMADWRKRQREELLALRKRVAEFQA